MTRLVDFGAWFGVVAGALRVISSFVPYVQANAALELLYGIIDLGMLFGLIAVHLATADRTGRPGLAFFVLALAGLASIVGPDSMLFGIDFYRLGAAAFSLGLAGMAIQLLRLGIRPFRIPAGLWIAAAAFGVIGAAAGVAAGLPAAGVTLGAGFVVAGAMRVRRSGDLTPPRRAPI